jgi:hypothetical protein
LLATWKAMRVGRLPLSTPVITSVEGRWVATMTWIPTARDFCARRVIACSASFFEAHHQVRHLVDDDHDVGHVRAACAPRSSLAHALAQLCLAERVVALDVAHAGVLKSS